MTTKPDFEALFRASPHPCLVLDAELQIVCANAAFVHAHQLSEAALVGRALAEALPSMPASAHAALALALASAEPQTVDLPEQRLLHTPVMGADGRPALLMQTALPLADPRLLEGMAAADLAVWEWDLPSGALAFSGNTTQVLGARPGTIDAFTLALDGADLALFEQAHARALAGQGSYHQTVRMRRPDDGRTRWIALGANVHCDAAGHPVTLRGVAQDVTAAVDATHALRSAASQKERCIAELAHQLRNPLAPISAAAQLLRHVQLDERRLHAMADIIIRQTGHASALLDDLTDLDRLNGGEAVPVRLPCDVRRVVSDAVEQLRPKADARSLRLAVLLPGEAITVLGEHRRLVQVLANLLDHAVNHTPAGGSIVLRVDTDGTHAVLRVRDDGVGIGEARLAHLFEPFAGGAAQRGTGLGLALAQRLVRLHGGTLAAASDGEGSGAELTVTLPLAPPADKLAGGSPAAAAPLGHVPPLPRSLRLMVVDDNPDAASTLSLLLEASGYDVSTEISSEAGLARALREMPDVCLLDIGMPGMDGYALARALRANPALAGTTLIAVTGYTQDKDRLQALAAGFDYHMAKPVDGAALSTLLQECAR